MPSKQAQEIKHGDTLGDGFLVESVYCAIGGIPRQFFAKGFEFRGSTHLSTRYLGVWGSPLTVKDSK